MNVTISLAQIDIAFGQPDKNIATVREMARTAAQRGSDWLIVPELWSTGYDLANAAAYATPTDAGVFAAVGQVAAEYNLHIVGSCLSVLPDSPDGIGNTLTWHDNTGTLQAEYSKLHLFRLMDEDRYLTAGDKPAVIETAWGKVGLSICYDLRFPELFRTYALGGATMMVVTAEWPYPRLAHWRTLLQARAIENQCFVIACNRVGTVGETMFCGHSAIIDPWGKVLLEGDDTVQLLTTTIDTGLVTAVREKIPVFGDRRPSPYTLPPSP